MNDLLSQPQIEKALTDARGDLFVASQLLDLTAIKLDRMLRASPSLQTFFLQVEAVAALAEYDQTTSVRFAAEVSRRRLLYQSDALDALHDLATMPVSSNSGLNQTKLLAASRLVGPQETQQGVSDLDSTLAALNDEYHKAAPRIKSVRERIITFETEPKVIAQAPAPEG